MRAASCPNCGASLYFIFADADLGSVFDSWFKRLDPVEVVVEVYTGGRNSDGVVATRDDILSRSLECPRCHTLINAIGTAPPASQRYGRLIHAGIDYALQVAT